MTAPHEITEAEARMAQTLANEDQMKRDWTLDAECLVAFWQTLQKAGMPDDLVGTLTVNSQIQYYSEDDDDDD